MQADNLGRCFITGGAGFIGSQLAAYLLRAGNTITVYDNLSLGRQEWIGHLLDKPRFRFVQADLRDPAAIQEAIAGHDLVFHFGANTDIPRGNQDTRIDLENETIATYNVLEAMRKLEIGKLVFASSSTVLGERPIRPTPETEGPLLPISLYGAGKLACEGLISAYCHLFAMQAWIFRFGNVVGAPMAHGILHDFITKLRQNPKEMEILGDGDQEKNYLLVEECIDAMLFAIRNAAERPCDVFNLGCESTVKASDIARIIAEEMELDGVSFHYSGGKQGWPGDVTLVVYDVTKMKRLGWQAKYTSAEAIRIAVRRLLDKEQPASPAGEAAGRKPR